MSDKPKPVDSPKEVQLSPETERFSKLCEKLNRIGKDNMPQGELDEIVRLDRLLHPNSTRGLSDEQIIQSNIGKI